MLAILSIFPTVASGESASVSSAVSLAVQVIADSGLDYRVTAMGTIVEGEAGDIFALLERCHGALAPHCERLYMTVALDDRRGATGRLDGKVDSVEQALGHPVPR